MRIKLMTGGAALASSLFLIALMHESAQSASMTGLSLGEMYADMARSAYEPVEWAVAKKVS